jgi:hypothetical protein
LLRDGLVVHSASVFGKIILFSPDHFPGPAPLARQGRDLGQYRALLPMTQLMQSRFHPRSPDCFIFGLERFASNSKEADTSRLSDLAAERFLRMF